MNKLVNKMKIMTVVGTRPEIIRLSRVMALLDKIVITQLYTLDKIMIMS